MPRIAVTMGDAAGIGAEITLKAVSDQAIKEKCRLVIIGDARFLTEVAADFGATALILSNCATLVCSCWSSDSSCSILRSNSSSVFGSVSG